LSVAYLSPSSISMFKQCPKRFQLEKILKALPPAPSGKEALVGTFVHAILENLLMLPVESRDKNFVKDFIQDNWQGFLNQPDLLLLNVEETELKHMVNRGLSGFFEMYDPKRIEVVSTEYELDMLLCDVPFRGYVDLIYKTKGWTVCHDHKNGKPPSPKYQEDKLMQLRLYALALRSLGIVVDEIVLSFISYREEISEVVSEATFESAEGVLRSVWGSVSDPLFEFVERTGALCNWCQFSSPEFCVKGAKAAEDYRRFQKKRG
jgi:putative RecB family exonuclease